jgi:polysaccharide pyruvyl transferase CsaB
VKRVFISGYYGFANAGDEAILTVMLGELRERIAGVEITVMSGRPMETASTHGVDTVLWSDPLAIAEAVRQADLVLVGGGGLFHDYTGFIPDALLTEGNWGIGFHCTPAILASIYQKPLMIYAVGVGPLYSKHAKQYTRAACAAAQTVTVRDAESKTLLVELGVPEEKVVVTADPAFSLVPVPQQISHGAKPLVGVVVRQWNFGVHPVFWEGELAAGLDLFLERNGGEIVFLPFQQFPGEAENDLAVSQRVRSRMKRQEQARVLEGTRSPAEVAGLLGSCDLVVGMRLHALIFSVVTRRPFVALRYDPKVTHAVDRVGRQRLSIDIGEIDAAVLADLMGEALATPPADAGDLAALAVQNAQLAVETMEIVPPASPPDEVLQLWRVATLAQLKAGDDYRRRIAYRIGQVEVLSKDFQSLEARHKQLSVDHKALQMESEAQQAALSQCREQSEARRLQVTGLVDRNQALETRAGHSEAVFAETVASLRRYLLDFNTQWNLYRSQRAWRAMLVVRRAYSILLREGIRGKLAFLPWLLTVLVGKPIGIEQEELPFPDVRTYLPDETRKRL